VGDNKSYNIYNCLVSAPCVLCTSFPVFCGRPFLPWSFFFTKSILFEFSYIKQCLVCFLLRAVIISQICTVK
jgi:hypothetical protein